MPNDINDYLAVDDKIETSPHLTDEQNVQIVMNSVIEGEKSFDKEEENETQLIEEKKTIPKLSDAYAAMRTLQRYGLGCSCPGMENAIFQVEDILIDQLLICVRQFKITDFFTGKGI